MFIITVIVGLVLGAGWMSAEYSFRAARTKNKLLADRQKRLNRQIEELHRLLESEQARSSELEELSKDTNNYKLEAEKLQMEITGIRKEAHRMEESLKALRARATAKEYLGNALGKVFVATIDNVLSPNKEESEKLSESAKNVFRKAKKAING